MYTNVIIVLADPLAAQGLRQWLHEHYQGVNAHVLSRVDEVPAIEAALYITDAPTFVSHLRFFLPRQSSSIVLAARRPATSDGSVTLVDANDTHALLAMLDSRLTRQSAPATQAPQLLSQRETDVLRLVAAGRLNKEIADQLGISINTVLTHRKNITAKLGIKSVSGLTFYAMMNGIVPSEAMPQ